jgi:hypothetical protein
MERMLKNWHLVIAILVTNVRRRSRQSRVMRYICVLWLAELYFDFHFMSLTIFKPFDRF